METGAQCSYRLGSMNHLACLKFTPEEGCYRVDDDKLDSTPGQEDRQFSTDTIMETILKEKNQPFITTSSTA